MTLLEFKPQYHVDGTVQSWYALVQIPVLDIMVEREIWIPERKPLDQFTEAEIEELKQKAVTFPTTEPIFYGDPNPQPAPDSTPV